MRATVEHRLAFGPSGWAARMLLLTDWISPVAGFEVPQAAFLAAMAGQRVRLATSTTAWPG